MISNVNPMACPVSPSRCFSFSASFDAFRPSRCREEMAERRRFPRCPRYLVIVWIQCRHVYTIYTHIYIIFYIIYTIYTYWAASYFLINLKCSWRTQTSQTCETIKPIPWNHRFGTLGGQVCQWWINHWLINIEECNATEQTPCVQEMNGYIQHNYGTLRFENGDCPLQTVKLQ
jgi:hypothetical protein